MSGGDTIVCGNSPDQAVGHVALAASSCATPWCDDPDGDGQPDGIYSFYGTDYRWEHGTSMATPHISGILGLALAVNPGLNQEQAQQLLYDTADQTGQCNEGCGAGLVNAGNLMMTVSGGYIPEATPRLAIDSDRVVFYQDQ